MILKTCGSHSDILENFFSSKLRGSAAGLTLPEFSKNKNQGRIKKRETYFPRLSFLFVLLTF